MKAVSHTKWKRYEVPLHPKQEGIMSEPLPFDLQASQINGKMNFIAVHRVTRCTRLQLQLIHWQVTNTRHNLLAP